MYYVLPAYAGMIGTSGLVKEVEDTCSPRMRG